MHLISYIYNEYGQTLLTDWFLGKLSGSEKDHNNWAIFYFNLDFVQ